MEISASLVKELREKTGVGIMDCKEALKENNGDLDKSVDYLRKKGIATAKKRGARTASEGQVQSYIHAGGKIGVLVEVNCETDFSGKTDDFAAFTKDIAMQVAAASPIVVERSSVPAEYIEKEKEIYRQQALSQGKPEQFVDKIVTGRLEKYYQEVVLLEQSFIKDSNAKVQDVLKGFTRQHDMQVTVNSFIRYQLGE